MMLVLSIGIHFVLWYYVHKHNYWISVCVTLCFDLWPRDLEKGNAKKKEYTWVRDGRPGMAKRRYRHCFMSSFQTMSLKVMCQTSVVTQYVNTWKHKTNCLSPDIHFKEHDCVDATRHCFWWKDMCTYMPPSVAVWYIIPPGRDTVTCIHTLTK